METKTRVFSDNEISEYRQVVFDIAKKRKNKLIISPSEKHAAIIFKNLIDQTSKEIFIYDKDLSGDLLTIEGGSLDILRNKVANQVKFVFVLDDISMHDSLREILDSEYVDIVQADEQFKESAKKILGKDYYFALADDSMFRLEYKDGSRNGICSFNDKNYALKLIKVFNSMKTHA